MRSAIVLMMVFIAVTFMYASATIINIPDDYPTIQEGIDASSDGDTVLVQPGTYVENIDFLGKAILVTSNFIFDQDSSSISQTIINGDSLATVVDFHSGESHSSVLGYLSITNGFGTGGYGDGGGVTCNDAAPTIIGCDIFSNTVIDGYGGGIHVLFSDAIIISNRIYDNVAIDVNVGYSSGGGIWVRNGSPLLSKNIIYNNHASTRAGGVGGGDSLHIVENVIFGNVCDYLGGGIQSNFSSSVIMFNVIYNNEASFGGGICISSGPYNYLVKSINNTIYGNSANSGGGIYCDSQAGCMVLNTIVFENIYDNIFDAGSPGFTVEYSDVQGGWPGVGNIDLDPLFRDPVNGDFHLMSTECGDPSDSPCIDAGDPAIFDSTLGCDWGLGELRSDMGAYGGEGIPTDVDEEQIPEIPMQFLLSQNYPNPFNASTVIQYNLPSASDVNIDIYDILGRKVETLVQGEEPAGYHQVTLDANDRSSGMYFYRIQAGEYTETRKMILLK